MKHEPFLANDLIYRSLLAKIEKLTARVEALEGAPKPARRKPKRPPNRKAQQQRPERDAVAFAGMTPICQAIADRYRLDLLDLRGREVADPRFVARGEAMYACSQAGFSTPVIGRYFDGRDHTSVLHLIKQHKERINPQEHTQ